MPATSPLAVVVRRFAILLALGGTWQQNYRAGITKGKDGVIFDNIRKRSTQK
jgi:hypothetical protein